METRHQRRIRLFGAIERKSRASRQKFATFGHMCAGKTVAEDPFNTFTLSSIHRTNTPYHTNTSCHTNPPYCSYLPCHTTHPII